MQCPCATRREMRSPRYTTRWDEVSGGGDEDRHCGESLLPTSICDPIPMRLTEDLVRCNACRKHSPLRQLHHSTSVGLYMDLLPR
ncbi:DUF4113 domain-containing protein [Stutzerimonas kunmingensis]|uniref:DUF4113 domain-containing protein n=1 Tax=Stutzerimonas stutzeri subgroup TaxID=578833 RepID=UPI001CD08C5E